jgi:spore germination protein KB
MGEGGRRQGGTCMKLGVFTDLYQNLPFDLRDGGDLLVTALYDQTPLLFINTLMIIAVVYVLYKGIEVFARIAEIYLLILIVLGVLGNLLVLFSGIIDVKNLLPIVEKIIDM